MKTQKKVLRAICGTALFVLAIACDKKVQTGGMNVRLTDAPAEFSQVNVEITGVDVHYLNEEQGQEGWTELNTNAGVYDLLTLQNNVSVILADGEKLPVGQINTLRLKLGVNNTVKTVGGLTTELKVPGGMESGIMLNLNTKITGNEMVDVLIDFDARESIVVNEEKFILTPVLKVESITII